MDEPRAVALAYVFWHSCQPAVERADYEARLLAFHDALAGARPDGFESSLVARLDGAPWLPGASLVYEDWYVIASSAGLDALNEAAIGPRCRTSHNAIAAVAGSGAGGLYRLRLGDGLLEAPAAAWFAKPDAETYADFYGRVSSWPDLPSAALWGRQMVLGPAPEFCLLTAVPYDVSADLAATTIKREVIAQFGESPR